MAPHRLQPPPPKGDWLLWGLLAVFFVGLAYWNIWAFFGEH